jgi:thymidylate synthase ThyX
VLDISRLATEFVQGNRLCSFTEKSQRYVRFQENVYIPPELADSPLYDKYWDVVHRQFQLYRELTDAIHRKLSQEPPESVNNKRSGYLENLAGEDARYILPLATYTQFGMTLNARALEWMVMKANAHPLPEIQEFARELSRAARQLTPSLIRYTEPTDDYKETPERIRKYIAAADSRSMNGGEERVRLLTYPEGGDDRLLATLLYSTSSTPWDACRRTIDSFDPNRKQLLFRDAMKGVGVHDPVWREFETLDFDFEVILSASAYAQLKRHRMSTQFMQGYDLALGVVVPTSVKDVNMERDFMDVINGAELLYKDIAEKNPTWADYVLTNAHCRRVLLHVNARELYHMARLRMDSGAQWEIRGIVEEIIQRVTEVCPLTFSLASGKDTFAHHYARLFADNGNIQSDL